MLMSDLYLSTNKLEPLFLHIFRGCLRLGANIKCMKGLMIQSMREIFTEEDFVAESLVLIGKIIEKNKKQEIYSKELVMVYFSKVYNFLLRNCEQATLYVLSLQLPAFNILFLENISDSLFQSNRLVDELRALKNYKDDEGFYNTYFIEGKLRWKRFEFQERTMIKLLGFLQVISRGDQLDANKHKKILMDIMEKVKKIS